MSLHVDNPKARTLHPPEQVSDFARDSRAFDIEEHGYRAGEVCLSSLKWLKLPEACDYARMSRNTLKKYISLGHFSGERLESGQWRIDRESIDAYFQRSDEKAVAICRELGL